MSSQGGCSSLGMSSADCPPLSGSPNVYNPPPNSYVVNSKIMVVAVAVLFAVVVFIICLHVYAKWFWRNQGALGATDGTLRTVSWRRRRRDARVQGPAEMGAVPLEHQSLGLQKAVIVALPTFEFDGKSGALECAVCLEEFEVGEKGRTLPKCGHHFHLECVDMWLHSHSTCPLCRASINPDENQKAKGTSTDAAVPLPSQHPHPGVPVMGDVQAPFMAAMRASRRRQRILSSSLAGATLQTSLPRSTADAPEHFPPESSPSQSQPPQHDSAPAPALAVDPKALALQYETIPSNVLFWGNNNNSGDVHDYESTPGAAAAQPSASQPGPTTRAPFQVTIDIPSPVATAQPGSHLQPQGPGIAMSPMARASASFRRLLSRGKSVVSPQGDGHGPDEGGPSSRPPHPDHHQTPPPPPNASQQIP